jgi:membrane protein insertase, YidC/Oxa1 family, C-terminal domain
MFELIDTLIVRPITNILFVVYGFVGDFGLAIILFTVLVKIFCWPLVKRQLHQTRLMRKIQPELAEIKKNCNGNRQLESLQMMDLYKRNNIKPFRSMLTLVIQLPIFIALYTAVRVMVQPTLSDNLEKRAYSFVAQIDKVEEVISFQQPYLSYQQTLQNIRNDSNLSDEEKNQKISDTPVTTYDFQPKLFNTVDLGVRPGFTSVSALIIMAFAIASAFAQYWISRQQLPSKKSQKSKSFRQIMREAADGKEPDQTELNAVMSGQMSKMMPIMMLLIMVNLPGALVFYYLVSNLMTGAQQKFVLSRSESEMEISADKRVIRELNKIEEGKVVKESGGAKVTRITAKSKRRGHKKGHK